ncbi:Polyketide cyclase / dehydrase and lipid transport [Modestobacter sp. DSM 44400]|uniref:SRPBCC family protein n=1 Tax=Modestobacter sp. DSM 44400 TaxID=1550230 RepID=UPI000898E076|nr:SRPBCC family protein [Modestobacter sp. DSM 44400]SDY56518.1 Polyketide cyclase / dehydrase and lipid transport [Modestobacter sp. DSM 44400]
MPHRGLARRRRRYEVVEAEPGRAFAFRTLPELDPTRRNSTTWGYRLEPADGGTRVTHSYEITRLPLRPFRALFGVLLPDHRDMRPQMRHNLEALGGLLRREAAGPAAAEQGARPGITPGPGGF